MAIFQGPKLVRALSGIFILGILASVPNAAPAQQGAATLVGVDQVRSEPLKQTVRVIGRLVARQAGVVAARTGGPVAKLYVEVGDRVKKGDVLAELVNERLHWERQLRNAKVAEAEAALKTARAQIASRALELKRLEGLRKSAAFSQARHDDKRQEMAAANSAAAEAEAALLSSRANLNLAEIELRYATIRAPFAGVVSKRHTEIGSYLNGSDPVVTLIDDRNLEIEAAVPAERIAGLSPGIAVSFLVTDGGVHPAVVRAVVPEENPLTRTRTVRFTPRLDGLANLATNQSVTLILPSGAAREVLSVHKDAILKRKGKTLVFVVNGDQVQVRPVILGDAVGSRFEVLDGLKVADVVVVRGNERLRPGQKVRFEGKS